MNSKLKICYFIPHFLVIILLSCSHEKSKDYFPMSVGNKWEYTFHYGSIFGVNEGRAITRISETVKIDGKKYFKYITVFSGLPGAEPVIEYVRKTKEGIYRIKGDNMSFGEYLDTKFPLTIGKSWESYGPEGTTYYRVEAIETVELFNESFKNCYKIALNSPEKGLEGYSYIAPDIGEVKSYGTGEGLTLESSLVQYEIK